MSLFAGLVRNCNSKLGVDLMANNFRYLILMKNFTQLFFCQAMLTKLDSLLTEEEVQLELEGRNESSGDQEARGGKSISPDLVERAGKVIGQVPGLVVAKVKSTNTTLHLFSSLNNLEHQIHSQLQHRLQFLETISQTMQRELQIFRQTVDFLRRLVNFKLDQTEILLGDMNPITEILQSGSTSIFLLITRFFESVEAVFALQGDFVRAFSGGTMENKEVNILERIIDLKLKTILPKKLRLLINIYSHSEHLREMIGEIFQCVTELIVAKRDLIASVGHFVEQKVR